MKEYYKCNFCLFHRDGLCMTSWCEGFKPDSDKIISKAKEESISVSDVVALIKLEMKYCD